MLIAVESHVFHIRPSVPSVLSTNLVELLKRFGAILLGLSALYEVWTKTSRGSKTYPYLHETVLHRRNYRQPMLYAAPQTQKLTQSLRDALAQGVALEIEFVDLLALAPFRLLPVFYMKAVLVVSEFLAGS